MKRIFTFILTLMMTAALVGCNAEAKPENGKDAQNTPPSDLLQAQMPNEGDQIAIVKTNLGEMRLQFFPEEAPKAVENFITHAKEGYYNGITFHRVINEFMIQGGDPTATGMGGESIWGAPFEDEISPKLHFFKGALAMANSGPNTNGSQFFIVQANQADTQIVEMIKESRESDDTIGIHIGENQEFIGLDEIFTDEVLQYYQDNGGYMGLEYVFGSPYTIFGQVYEGFDTLDAIAVVETDASDKPVENVVIESITIEEYKAQ